MNFDKIIMNPPYSNGLGGKSNAKHCKKYLSQKCFYEGEYITLDALAQKLRRLGFSNTYK